MSCPVTLHATGATCGQPTRATAELCEFHAQRRRFGWTDHELGLPRYAPRQPHPTRACSVVEHDTGAPCPRPYLAVGFCQLHYHRHRAGWAGEDLGRPLWTPPNEPARPEPPPPDPPAPPSYCPVTVDATAQPCGEEVRSLGLCHFHAQRRRNGWTDDELGLPRNARRRPPTHTHCTVIEHHTDRPCPRPHSTTGLCGMHYVRRRNGWTDDELGLPPFARRAPRTARTCVVTMHDDTRCGRRVARDDMCLGHCRRVDAEWPPDRLGAPFRGTPRCGVRTPDGPCRTRVATHGDRCADHPGPTVPTAPVAATAGRRRPMVAIDPTAVDTDAERLEREFRSTAATAQAHRYQRQWFEQWAVRHGVDATPPVAFSTVAHYLVSMTDPGRLDPGRGRDEPYSFSHIAKARSAIRDLHLTAGYPSPTDDPMMPALWAGLRRLRGAQPTRATVPVTVADMRAIMSHPPTPTAKVHADRALLGCVRHLGVDPHDLAGATATVDPAGRVQLDLGDGDPRAIDTKTPAGDALAALIAADPDRRWRFAADRELLALRQGELVARGGVPAGRRAHHVTAMTDEAFTRCLQRCDPETSRWIRDRAFILLAWHACLDHHLWSELRWDVDLTRSDDHWRVTVPDGPGRTATLTVTPANDPSLCAVGALDEWRHLANPRPGELVFPTSFGRRVVPLGTQAASKRLKAAFDRAGVDGTRYATKSLAYGFVVTAVTAGANAHQIAGKARISPRSAQRHLATVAAHHDAADRVARLTRSPR